MPRVSVVIPAFNAEPTLGAAVESALGQIYTDAEVIVVDDGSSDETAAVAARYGASVTCIRTENGGVSRARNTGMAAATGEFVAFLDADDAWKPEKLEKQVKILDTRPGVGIVTSASHRVDAHLRVLEYAAAREHPDPCRALLLHAMVLGQISSPLVRRALAVEIGGFDERLSQCADWDFFIRLSLRTEFAVIEEPLVLYRVTDHNMSRDIALLERDTFPVLHRFFEGEAARVYRPLRRRAYSNHWMILSGSYLRAGQQRDAVRCLLRGISLYPPNVSRALQVLAGRGRRLVGARAKASGGRP